jgi:hypothetical protein
LATFLPVYSSFMRRTFCTRREKFFDHQRKHEAFATAQVQVPYLLGLDRLFTIAGFVMPEVPAMTPGIDDPPSWSLSQWAALSWVPSMRIRGGDPHDGPSDFSQLHTLLLCAAFVRHLSRMISEYRH